MGKDYGEPIRYDPNFNGPIHNRSCTDIIWLILFILFLGVWGYVGFHGMQYGNIKKLVAPVDSSGLRCGLDSTVADKPYLAFFDITKCLQPDSPIVGCPTPQVCVKECPTETIHFNELTTEADFIKYRSNMVCTYDVIDINTMTLYQAKEYISMQKCAASVLKSQSVMYRCLSSFPTFMEEIEQKARSVAVPVNVGNVTESITRLEDNIAQKLSQLVNYDQISAQIVQDLVQSRWYLLGALGAIIILCFVYILLLRWVVGPVVWASIAMLLGLLGFCVYLCYKNYAYYKANPVILQKTTNLKGYFESIFTDATSWLIIMIIVAVFLIVLLLMVIFLRNRISIAIALIQEGSKAVTAIKSTIAFPIFPWIIQCFVIAYGAIVLMYLLSLGQPTFQVVNLQNDTSCDCRGVYTKDYEKCNPATFLVSCQNNGYACSKAVCHFTGLEAENSYIYLLHLANLLGFFWTMFFISGVSDMILASTFSTWYWTFRKKDLPFFTLTSGISRTFRYHLGTVALGALIIAIVRVIRVILEYIDQKLKKFDNPFTRCVLCCCKCFFWCLESFLRFINKNAYIMCAVHGHSFCKSARDAFSLLMRNIVRVVVIDKVTDFLFFLSKLLISVGVGVAVYYILELNVLDEVTNGARLHYNYIPAVILSIATYLICTLFFKVYEMAVDTLFLCFLEDCERNDGSPEKPYFMSKNLMKILGKRNKQL